MLKIIFIPILMSLFQGPVTMTSVDHISGTDSLKVTITLTYDLFLRDYQQSIDDDLDLHVLRGFKPFPDNMISNYINSKIFISINNKPLVGKLVKSEIADDTINLNIHYRAEKKIKNITIRNTILTGLYSDVENLTIIWVKNLEKGIKFTQEYKEETLVLK